MLNGNRIVYTVTFNPALDYRVILKKFQAGILNRAYQTNFLVGGKGINVSLVLNEFGVENRALGFLAGFTGEEIEKRLLEAGCKADFIKLPEGVSRINIKIKGEEETELNGIGPDIPQKAIEELFQKLEGCKREDYLVLAGSLPASVNQEIYDRIFKLLSKEQVSIVVDASGSLLLRILPYHPFLIKPNLEELGELFQTEIKQKEQAVFYAKKLKTLGARNVLVSMGQDGALLIDEDEKIYECKALQGELKNPVGAGDSMVAGFVAGYIKERNYEYALKLGVCAGSASAFSENLAKKEEIENLWEQMGEFLS